ncbi:MAG: hypothetical protein HYS56_04585, partial [Candidatus Omnitrophica bacterium]|nr:hypothetical protein [Candidatus Omnitrophota bacterium]
MIRINHFLLILSLVTPITSHDVSPSARNFACEREQYVKLAPPSSDPATKNNRNRHKRVPALLVAAMLGARALSAPAVEVPSTPQPPPSAVETLSRYPWETLTPEQRAILMETPSHILGAFDTSAERPFTEALEFYQRWLRQADELLRATVSESQFQAFLTQLYEGLVSIRQTYATALSALGSKKSPVEKYEAMTALEEMWDQALAGHLARMPGIVQQEELVRAGKTIEWVRRILFDADTKKVDLPRLKDYLTQAEQVIDRETPLVVSPEKERHRISLQKFWMDIHIIERNWSELQVRMERYWALETSPESKLSDTFYRIRYLMSREEFSPVLPLLEMWERNDQGQTTHYLIKALRGIYYAEIGNPQCDLTKAFSVFRDLFAFEEGDSQWHLPLAILLIREPALGTAMALSEYETAIRWAKQIQTKEPLPEMGTESYWRPKRVIDEATLLATRFPSDVRSDPNHKVAEAVAVFQSNKEKYRGEVEMILMAQGEDPSA